MNTVQQPNPEHGTIIHPTPQNVQSTRVAQAPLYQIQQSHYRTDSLTGAERAERSEKKWLLRYKRTEISIKEIIELHILNQKYQNQSNLSRKVRLVGQLASSGARRQCWEFGLSANAKIKMQIRLPLYIYLSTMEVTVQSQEVELVEPREDTVMVDETAVVNQPDVHPDTLSNTSKEVVQPNRSRKCFNATCNNSKIYKRIKSKIQTSKYRTLCKSCHTNYSNNQFCQFCQQIYDNTVNDDEQDWVGCDTCERWNHVHCQMKHRLKDADKIKLQQRAYQCLSCSQKFKNKKLNEAPPVVNPKRPRVKQVQDSNPYYYDIQPSYKKKTYRQLQTENKDEVYQNSRPETEYISVFTRYRQVFPAFEAFMQSCVVLNGTGVKIGISDQQIREDLSRLKQIKLSKEASQPDSDFEGKKVTKRHKK